MVSPDTDPKPAMPNVGENRSTLALELTPEETAPYHDLLKGLFEKYQNSTSDCSSRDWTDKHGPRKTTSIFRRDAPDGSCYFMAQRDDLTGRVSSSLIIDAPEARKDSLAGHATFTQTTDGRVFLVYGTLNYYPDTELVYKSQPELKEVFAQHVEGIKTIEQQRSTLRARIERLGQRVMEKVRRDPYRIRVNDL